QFFIEKPWILELADTDKTPGNEILTIDNKSGRLICYKFATEKNQDSDWPILFYPLASGEGKATRDLAVADFDGDGLDDVVISDPAAAEFIFYKQIKQLGLAEPLRFPALSDITNISVADIDRDNKPEIGVLSVNENVIGLSKFENGRLSFPKPIDLTGEPVAMELADLDRDGNIDCLYISKDVNDIRSMKVIYNLSALDKIDATKEKKRKTRKKFGEVEPALELEKLNTNPSGLKILDFDHDGLLDVLIFVKYELPVLVRQTQKRKFELVDSPKTKASLIKNANPHSTFAANVDSHAGQELLLAQNNFARSLVLSKNQSWNILDQYNAKSTENQISAIAAFNINNASQKTKPSILLLDGQKGQLQILNAGADKIYRFEKELDVGKWNAANHLKMFFAPLTGTEEKSILLFDSEKFALITPPNGENAPQQLEQQFSYETKIKDGTYGNLTLGDINSDGQLDIIMVEFKRNHIEILTLDQENEPMPAMRFKIFEDKSYRNKKRSKANVEPKELKIADVSGDGKADLITVIHDRIIIYPQD
ncbi:MAG: VCBS repeat-containing protein, partial [Planctomycetes bacterium]|nr:VCBS repeat-containing protein [Planctomycetota bacterium]